MRNKIKPLSYKSFNVLNTILLISCIGHTLLLMTNIVAGQYVLLNFIYMLYILINIVLYLSYKKINKPTLFTNLFIGFNILLFSTQVFITSLAYHVTIISLLYLIMLVWLLLDKMERLVTLTYLTVFIIYSIIYDLTSITANDIAIDYLDQVFGTMIIGFLVCFVIVSSIKELNSIKNKMEEWSLLDPLTGVGNNRYLQFSYDRLNKDYLDQGKPFVLAILDLDDFKTINDQYGHHMGDQALKSLTHIINKNIRRNDALFRYGGDEFILLLEEQTVQTAEGMLKRLLPCIRDENSLEDILLNASIGVADITETAHDLESLIKLADKRLYAAKKQGKHRVCSQI